MKHGPEIKMPNANFLIVDDVLVALQALATYHRDKFNLKVIGITGSNGKTTTKEMIAAILSRLGACMATHGNLNNHIGVPLTLMRLEPAHRSAVVESPVTHGHVPATRYCGAHAARTAVPEAASHIHIRRAR